MDGKRVLVVFEPGRSGTAVLERARQLTARRDAELDENCALFDLPIPAELWPDLRAHGLLDERAPVPS